MSGLFRVTSLVRVSDRLNGRVSGLVGVSGLTLPRGASRD